MKLSRLSLSVLALLMLVTAPAFNGAARADDEDHDRARSAVEQGKARPLVVILKIVRPKLGGRIVDVEFETEDGVYVYEFKVIRPDGAVREIYVDAQTGKILKVEAD